MKKRFQLLTVSLLALSTFAATANAEVSKAASKASCCEAANNTAEFTRKAARRADKATLEIEEARKSNDVNKLRAALELAYKSLNDIKGHTTKGAAAMDRMHDHLVKVETLSSKIKQDQAKLDAMLQGDGLEVELSVPGGDGGGG